MTLSPDSKARITQYVREQFGQPSVVLCYISALSEMNPDGALWALTEFNRLYRANAYSATASATDAVEACYRAATVCAEDAK